MKIFTLISLLIMPATLVASFYGMNVKLPLAGIGISWVFILVIMVLFAFALWFTFKKKKLL